jgi:hypothetical protein
LPHCYALPPLTFENIVSNAIFARAYIIQALRWLPCSTTVPAHGAHAQKPVTRSTYFSAIERFLSGVESPLYRRLAPRSGTLHGCPVHACPTSEMPVESFENSRSTNGDTRITPRSAALVGGVLVLFGLYAIVAGLGVVRVRFSPGVQPWVVVAAGAMFMLAGLSVINGRSSYGAPYHGKDPGREVPFHVQLIGLLLSLSVLGLMCAIFVWVAFGPGERHFSTWSTFSGRPLPVEASERPGRIAFGICAGILAALLILSGVGGIRRLRAAR